MPNKCLGDINSLKEFERIPHPELIDEDDLLLIEDENGKLRSVKYKDLISSAALEAGLVGPTGPQGEKGHPGVDIVEEFDEPDPEAVIWVQEGEYPEEDLANNIDGYLHDFIRFGEESPYENPEVTDRTMIYLQIDERLEQSNIRVIKVPNDESNFQKQLDLLRNRLDALEDDYVEVYDEELDGEIIEEDDLDVDDEI